MRRISLSFVSIIFSVLLISAAAAAAFLSFDEAELKEKQTRLARDSVMNTVAACYAFEGRYPDDLEYLQQNYGLKLDTKHYIYHYEKFASNILPDVRVFLKPGV